MSKTVKMHKQKKIKLYRIVNVRGVDRRRKTRKTR